MLCIFSAIYTYVTASSPQVLSRWQQLSLPDMAAQQPNADLVIVADEDALLVQSVPLHDRHDGVTAVMLLGDPSLDAAVVVHTHKCRALLPVMLSSTVMSACQGHLRQY